MLEKNFNKSLTMKFSKIKTKKRKKPSSNQLPVNISFEKQVDQNVFRKLFWILVILFSIFLSFSTLKVGIPADEPIDSEYGKSALKYYTSLGKDTSFMDLKVYGRNFDLQKYYGAGFEMISAAITSNHTKIRHFTIRHLLVAFCGIIILIFTGLIGKILSGWETALIAIILLITTPTLVGNMMFNSKDIPYAMGCVVMLFFLIKFSQNLPKVHALDIFGIIFGIGIAVSIRIGGLLLGGYFLTFLGMKFIFNKQFRTLYFSQTSTKKIGLLVFALLIVVSGYLLGLIFYPNFWEEPFQHISKALSVVSDFPAKITMLFEGKLIKSTDLPDNYLIKSLLISIPFHVLILIPLVFFLIPKMTKNYGISNILTLCLTCFFPIL